MPVGPFDCQALWPRVDDHETLCLETWLNARLSGLELNTPPSSPQTESSLKNIENRCERAL